MRLISFLPRGRIILGLAALLVADFPGLWSHAWAEESADRFKAGQRATLRGIRVVRVTVENIWEDTEMFGLTRDILQTDVELRLRRAGIGVGPSNEGFLYVNVSTRRSPNSEVIAFHIEVQFHQEVVLDRDSKTRISAPTWDTGGTGIVGRLSVKDYVRKVLADEVDKFINAYLEQNPRK